MPGGTQDAARGVLVSEIIRSPMGFGTKPSLHQQRPLILQVHIDDETNLYYENVGYF